MADRKTAREQAIEAAKQRARQKILEQQSSTEVSTTPDAAQEAVSDGSELTANEQMMADQQMADSGRITNLREAMSGPGLTQQDGSDQGAGDASSAEPSAGGFEQRIVSMGEGTSPETKAALDMFNRITSGDTSVGDGPEIPEGPTSGGSQNSYDGPGSTRPTQADISTVFRVNPDMDRAEVVHKPEEPPATVDPDGTIHIPPSETDSRRVTVHTDGTVEIEQTDPDDYGVIIIDDEEDDGDGGSDSTAPSAGMPVDDELTPEQKAAWAERLRALTGGQDPREARQTGMIDYGEGGTGRFVEGTVTSDYKDRLTGDGDDLVEGGGGNGEAVPDGTLAGQDDVINWGPDGSAGSGSGQYLDVDTERQESSPLSNLASNDDDDDDSSSLLKGGRTLSSFFDNDDDDGGRE